MSFVDDDVTDGQPPPKQRRGGRGPRDPLGPDGEIGVRLRALYAEVEREPIPMQLIDLLEKLSEAEREAGQ